MRNILFITLIIIGAVIGSCDEGLGEYPEGGMISDGYAYLTDSQNDWYLNEVTMNGEILPYSSWREQDYGIKFTRFNTAEAYTIEWSEGLLWVLRDTDESITYSDPLFSIDNVEILLAQITGTLRIYTYNTKKLDILRLELNHLKFETVDVNDNIFTLYYTHHPMFTSQ